MVRLGPLSVLTALVTVVAVYAAVKTSKEEYDYWKEEYEYNRRMMEIMGSKPKTSGLPMTPWTPYKTVPYTQANISENYRCKAKNDIKSSSFLYAVANKILGTIETEVSLPADAVDVKKSSALSVTEMQSHVMQGLFHYHRTMLFMVISLIVSVVFPVIGVMFCCARQFGYCGGYTRPVDKKHDVFRRTFYGGCLIGGAVLLSFCMVCTFSTNETVNTGISEFPQQFRLAIDDVHQYFDNTKEELHVRTVTNFQELEQTLNNMLSMTGKFITKRLAEETKATVLANLTSVMNGLSAVQNDLNMIDFLTHAIKKQSGTLNYGLKTIVQKISNDMEQCSDQLPCREFLRKYDISNLTIEADFSELPSVTATLKNLSDVTASGLGVEIKKCQDNFFELETFIQADVDDAISPLLGSVRDMGKSLEEGTSRIIEVIDRVDKFLYDYALIPVEFAENFIKEYSPYRHYIGLTMGFGMSLVWILITFALFCGCCASRPKRREYESDCCTKATASAYLISATFLMFVFGGVFIATTGIYMAAGVTMDKVICHTFQHPDESPIYRQFDRWVDIDKFFKYGSSADIYDPVTILKATRECHEGKTFYKILRLYKFMNIDHLMDYINSHQVVNRLRDFSQRIKLKEDITILTDRGRELLLDLANSELSTTNIPAYTNRIGDKITNMDLLEIAGAINETVSVLPSNYENISYSLLNSALYLQTHHKLQVVEMIRNVAELEVTTQHLQSSIKFNHTSLKQAIEIILRDVDVAQNNLKTDGPATIAKLARRYEDEFALNVEDYFKSVIKSVNFETGNCWPVSEAYNVTVDSVCKNILLPFNGFWMSLVFALVLFLPMGWFNVQLSSLYRKSTAYTGNVSDMETMYDTYGDRENVPLSRGAKRHGRCHGELCMNDRSQEDNHFNPNIPSTSAGFCVTDDVVGYNENDGVRLVDVTDDLENSVAVTEENPVQTSASDPGINQVEDGARTWDTQPNITNKKFRNSAIQLGECGRPPPYYYPGSRMKLQGSFSDQVLNASQ